jgi:glycosyltransferase involved in cell wall biosynthesis
MTSPELVKVLFCENNVDGTIGGSYYSLLYLAMGLTPSRYRPIVVFYTEHALIQAFHDAGIETQVWPKAKSYVFASRVKTRALLVPLLILQKALNFWSGFVIPVFARAWFLRSRGIRIVHVNNSVLYNHDWMMAARIAHVPCVTHERGINDCYPAVARFFGKGLAAIVCISEAVKYHLQQHGLDFGNLVTIHNGLDPAMMRTTRSVTELRASLGIPADARVIGMVGNIRAWKGQDTLIRAMQRVRLAFPSVNCVLVGTPSSADEGYAQTLRDLVSSLGLENCVYFAGFQPNVTDFLMMFDIVVHASVLPEPFGRVILEAMACRKPVVGARAGAVPEIIDEGKTGLMFPPGDAEALADAIIALLSDPATARRLGDSGYDRLVREFHITRNVAETERIYERLVGAGD